MYFLFVDESGSPEKSDPSLVFTLVGTAFQVEEYKKFTGPFNAFKHDFYPEIMNKSLTMNPKRDKLIREQQELKEILKPKSYGRRNQRFMTAVLTHCIQKSHISVHPVIFLKEQLDNIPRGTWIYPLAFKRLLTSFNNFLLTKNDNGIAILDSRDPVSDDQLVASFYSHTSRDPFGIACTNMIGPPLFARSRITYGLQLAHHIAYLAYGHYFNCYYAKKGGKDYAHVTPFWGLLSNRSYEDLDSTSALYGEPNTQKGIIVWQ